MENIIISGEELRQLLKRFGYYQPEFANYCQVTTAQIKYQLKKSEIGRKYSEMLIEMLGINSFDEELRSIRGKNRLRINNLRYLQNELFDKRNDNLTLQEFRKKVTQ